MPKNASESITIQLQRIPKNALKKMVQIKHDFSNRGICGQTFEMFKTFEPNFRETYELQELTTDLRFS